MAKRRGRKKEEIMYPQGTINIPLTSFRNEENFPFPSDIRGGISFTPCHLFKPLYKKGHVYSVSGFLSLGGNSS